MAVPILCLSMVQEEAEFYQKQVALRPSSPLLAMVVSGPPPRRTYADLHHRVETGKTPHGWLRFGHYMSDTIGANSEHNSFSFIGVVVVMALGLLFPSNGSYQQLER